ncbi:MAG: FtsX-like permease family protein [Bacteroidia bacterium]|nr:FtsX-like permease family protein [Bacteroidia bacterium]
MNLLKLSWKNLFAKPLSTLLTLVLFALGVGLIIFLILFNQQLQNKFNSNLASIDLVIGAKGSPLQLILCNMYHIDAPTGNIKIEEAKAFLNPNHPLIDKAYPLSLGDSYQGFRIVGTTHEFVDLYKGKIAEGHLWGHHAETVIGSLVAERKGLKIGDTFLSNHGLLEDVDMNHGDHPFKVVGILKPTDAVIDQLILTSTESIWDVHAPHEDDHDHEEEGHDHGDNEIDFLLKNPDKEITSILVRFTGKTNYQALNMQRGINENTDLQAASPAIEINRLYNLMGVGERALRMIAILIIIVSGLSIFISLYNALKERKYELALMRTMGAYRSQMLWMILLEGLIMAIVGFVAGWVLGHAGMEVMSGSLREEYNYRFTGWIFNDQEWIILVISIGIGIISAIIPAWNAYRTDIVHTLTEG